MSVWHAATAVPVHAVYDMIDCAMEALAQGIDGIRWTFHAPGRTARGFTASYDAPLDMRMNLKTSSPPARCQ